METKTNTTVYAVMCKEFNNSFSVSAHVAGVTSNRAVAEHIEDTHTCGFSYTEIEVVDVYEAAD